MRNDIRVSVHIMVPWSQRGTFGPIVSERDIWPHDLREGHLVPWSQRGTLGRCLAASHRTQVMSIEAQHAHHLDRSPNFQMASNGPLFPCDCLQDPSEHSAAEFHSASKPPAAAGLAGGAPRFLRPPPLAAWPTADVVASSRPSGGSISKTRLLKSTTGTMCLAKGTRAVKTPAAAPSSTDRPGLRSSCIRKTSCAPERATTHASFLPLPSCWS
jgi:hypothetical protein